MENEKLRNDLSEKLPTQARKLSKLVQEVGGEPEQELTQFSKKKSARMYMINQKPK
jgi:hypothetical protein